MKFIKKVVLFWSAAIAGFLILGLALYGIGLLLPGIEPDFGVIFFILAYPLWGFAVTAIALFLILVYLSYRGIRKII